MMNRNMFSLFLASVSAALYAGTAVGAEIPASFKLNMRQAPAAEEQAAKTDPALMKEFQNIQRMIRERKYAEAEKAAAELHAKAAQASAAFRWDTFYLRVSCAMAQKDYAGALKLIESMPLDKMPLCNAFTYAYRDRVACLEQLKRYDEAASAAFERLAMPAARRDAEIPQIKEYIIRLAFLASKDDAAIALTKELIGDPEFKNSARVLSTTQNYLQKDKEKLLNFNADMMKFTQDPALRLILKKSSASALASLKRTGEAAALEKEIFEDENASADMAVRSLTAWTNLLYPANKKLDRAPVLAAADKLLLRKDLPDLQRYFVLNLKASQLQTMGDKDAVIPVLDEILALPKLQTSFKVQVLNRRALLLLKKNQPEEAEKTLKQGFSYEPLAAGDTIALHRALAAFYSWTNRPEQAFAMLDELEKKQPALKKQIDGIRAEEYNRNWQFDKAAEKYIAVGNIEKALPLMKQKDKRVLCLKVLADKNASAQDRLTAWLYFFAQEPGNAEIREKYREDMKSLSYRTLSNWAVKNILGSMLRNGSYENALELLQLIRSHQELRDNFFNIRWQIVSLYALKRDAEAAALAKEYMNFEKFKAGERFYLRILAELGGSNFASALPKVLKECPVSKELTAKGRSDMLVKAGSAALLAGKEDALRAIEKEYKGLYQQNERKIFDVPFVSTPIRNVSDFLALKNPPKPQLMDRAFGGSLDFLETDVSTGERGAEIGKARGKSIKFNEFSALCDEYGLHLFFKVPAENPAAMMAGLAGAGSFEMYLAAGENQPYTCLLADVNTSHVSLWNTTYENAGFHRINQKAGEILCDNAIGKDWILKHIFISWTAYPMTVPDSGDVWEFENVHWSAAGGYGWNGTESIHGRSTWGHLRFHLTPAQRSAVKRHIIFDALRKYKKQKRISSDCSGVIFFWQDPVLGDTEFYNEIVKPLVERLDSFIPLVKADMSDADTDKVFREAVPLWENLPFEIARLRAVWMEDRLTRE